MIFTVYDVHEVTSGSILRDEGGRRREVKFCKSKSLIQQ